VRSFLKFCQEQGAIEVAVASLNRYLDLREPRRPVAAAHELSPRHLAAVMLMPGLGGLRYVQFVR
jgi:hypothetical protein